METCEVQNAVALGPFCFWHIQHTSCASCGLHVSCSHCVMHLRNNVIRNNWRSWSRCITGADHIFEYLLSHTDLAEYMGHVFGDDFGNKHARYPQHSSHFDNTVLPYHYGLSQAQLFRRHVRAHDWRFSRPTSYFIGFLSWISGERCSLMYICIPPLSYTNFLRAQRSCFIGWLVDWLSVGLELRR